MPVNRLTTRKQALSGHPGLGYWNRVVSILFYDCRKTCNWLIASRASYSLGSDITCSWGP